MSLASTQLRAAWSAEIASVVGAMRHERRLLIGLFVRLAFSFALGAWSMPTLLTQIRTWSHTGDLILARSLWQVLLSAFAALLVLSVLTLFLNLRSERQEMLLGLPVRPATMMGILYGAHLLNLWNWLLLQAFTCGSALLLGLGWRALPWLLLLLTGMLFTTWLGFMGSLLYLRYFLPPQYKWVRLAVLSCVIVLPALSVWLIATQPMLLQVLMFAIPVNLLAVGVILLALWLLLLGPLARIEGCFLVGTLLTLQSLDHSPKTRVLPGIPLLQRVLERRRTLLAAFFVKTLDHQGRNLFFWLRAALLLPGLIFFAQVRHWLALPGLSDMKFTAIYATLLTLLPVMEVLPNAIAGEGSRFTLYLLLPMNVRTILRARVLHFLLPLLTMGVLLVCFLGWLLYLAYLDILYAMSSVVLIVSNTVCFAVLASPWDLNLQLQVEGAEQHLLQEEGPFSPRRMLIFQLSLLLLALQILMLWRLPAPLALVLLLVLTLLLLPILGHLSMRQVARQGS